MPPDIEAAWLERHRRRLAEIEPAPPLWADTPDPRADPAFEPAPPGHPLAPADVAATVDDYGQARLLRNDEAKVELGEAIARAAGDRWASAAVSEAVWLEARGRAMAGCRSVRAYRDALCGGYLARPNSCRVRVCPDCERARSARLAERFAGLTLDMRRAVFWTFTVPNVAAGELSGGVDWLLEAFRRLRRRAIIRGGRCRECGRKHGAIAGGVYSLEITWRPERGEWHPHVHALMDAPYIRWAEMRAAWRAATCDAIRYLAAGGGRLPRCDHGSAGCRGASVLWVSAVRGAPGTPERVESIRETLKYAVGGLVKKDGTLNGAEPARLGDLLLALRNRRLVAGFGAWRNVTDLDPEDESPDILRGPDVPPELRGLPAKCPHCGQAALWEQPIEIPRRACYLATDGSLRWRAPPPAPV